MLAPMMRDIIQTEYFRVVVVDDEDAVEICGALKVSFNNHIHVIRIAVFYVSDGGVLELLCFWAWNRHIHVLKTLLMI